MPRFTANVSTMFREYPFLERFEAAKKAGFHGIELQSPYETPINELAAAINATGFEIAVFNFPMGDIPEGGPGLACMPERTEAFRDAVVECLRYADGLHPRTINMLAGLPPDGSNLAACRQTLIENARILASALSERGIKLLIEAINTRDRPRYFLPHSRDVLGLMAEAAHPNLALEYDLYHMQIMEGDLIPTMQRILPDIGHIQFADTPGRHEPGTGEINFPVVFAALDDMGYDGYLGAEYFPSGRTEDSLHWLQPYLD